MELESEVEVEPMVTVLAAMCASDVTKQNKSKRVDRSHTERRWIGGRDIQSNTIITININLIYLHRIWKIHLEYEMIGDKTPSSRRLLSKNHISAVIFYPLDFILWNCYHLSIYKRVFICYTEFGTPCIRFDVGCPFPTKISKLHVYATHSLEKKERGSEGQQNISKRSEINMNIKVGIV